VNLKKLCVLLFLCVSNQIIAFQPSSVIIKLTNKSTQTLEFDRFDSAFPGNEITIDKKKLRPGEAATVIGTITRDFDLSATMYFKEDTRFYVKVRREFHTGQPVFKMKSELIDSAVTSRTLNPVKNPKLLNWIAADVVLKDRGNF
jgi:hypothetical protein